MEILFKNIYTRNKEMAKEIYGYYYFKRKFSVIMNILIAFFTVVNIVLFALNPSYYLSIVAVVIALLVVAFRTYCYFLQVNTLVKRDEETNGKELEIEVIVTQDYIQNTTSSGAFVKIEYDKFSYAVQTKNLIILRSKANLLYLFKKDSFEIGTKEEFVSFLKAKGIVIKGK